MGVNHEDSRSREHGTREDLKENVRNVEEFGFEHIEFWEVANLKEREEEGIGEITISDISRQATGRSEAELELVSSLSIKNLVVANDAHSHISKRLLPWDESNAKRRPK